jgi:hypothetical protein
VHPFRSWVCSSFHCPGSVFLPRVSVIPHGSSGIRGFGCSFLDAPAAVPRGCLLWARGRRVSGSGSRARCFAERLSGSHLPAPSAPACLASPVWFPASSSWFLGSVVRPVRPGLGVTAGRATGHRCVSSLPCEDRGAPFPFLVAGAARGTFWTSPLPGRPLDPRGLYLSHLEQGIGIPDLSGGPHGNNDEMEKEQHLPVLW